MRWYQRVIVAGAAVVALVQGAVAAERAGTTLRFIPQADLRVLDPIWTTGLITRNHAYMIYDTLFGFDDHFEPRPQMVDKWTVSEDKLLYTFTLRDKLAFHDGQPVRSVDCIASIARWMTRDGLGQKLAEVVGEMKPLDDKSFTIALKRPFPLLLRAFGKISGNPFIMPERIAKTDGNTQIAEHIGSGPYKFVAAEWEPGHKVVYARNADYVPRAEPPNWTAGGKLAKVDRIEWIYIPDAGTAANALMAGEVDWWQQVPADLVPLLQKAGGITVTAPDTVGSIGVFGLNHQQAPFNNPKLRQAMLYAVDQKDYMSAAAGDQKYWRTCYSYYPCNTPNASEAGAEALKAPRDLAKAKALVKESGYKGERIVLLDATDYPAVHAEAAVTADLLQQLGLKVEVQAMDWGSVLTRRAKHGSVEEGGWSIYHTSLSGADAIDPAVSLGLRGNGDKAWFGWPEDPQMEALRDRWIDSEDPAEQKRIAVDLQVQAFKTVPFIPLGRFDIPTAYRKTLDGVILAPLLVMWNVEKR